MERRQHHGMMRLTNAVPPASMYFRRHKIENTQPRLSIVAKVTGPGMEMCNIARERLNKNGLLALQTPYAHMNVIISQTTLRFQLSDEEKYDPSTLPNDLMAHMKDIILRELVMAHPGNFTCTGRLFVFGDECPAYVAMEVVPTHPNHLLKFRRMIHHTVKRAMQVEAEANRGTMRYDNDSCTLFGRGWKLVHESFEEYPIRAYITLGILRSKTSIDSKLSDGAEMLRFNSDENDDMFVETNDDSEAHSKLVAYGLATYCNAFKDMVEYRLQHRKEDNLAEWNRVVGRSLNERMKKEFVGCAAYIVDSLPTDVEKAKCKIYTNEFVLPMTVSKIVGNIDNAYCMGLAPVNIV